MRARRAPTCVSHSYRTGTRRVVVRWRRLNEARQWDIAPDALALLETLIAHPEANSPQPTSIELLRF